ncbi:hypothetical protein HAX54_011062, partial [Datura stramonium]|nr:hypothetical protein [Datura stramonium]
MEEFNNTHRSPKILRLGHGEWEIMISNNKGTLNLVLGTFGILQACLLNMEELDGK